MIKKKIECASGELILESGHLAQRADGSVLVKYGNTHILCTVCCKKKVDSGVGFFPLSVHYQERFYAIGRIPGGFFKREGRPSEREVITSRLIDRSIRPLFPEGFLHEVQVSCILLSYDPLYDVEVPAMAGVSAALLQAGLPIKDVVASAKVGILDGECQSIRSYQQAQDADMEVFVSGTKNGILMVEAAAQEQTEDDILSAILQAHDDLQVIIEGIEEAFKPNEGVEWQDFTGTIHSFRDDILAKLGKSFKKAYATSSKKDRDAMLKNLRDEAASLISEDASPAVAYAALTAAESVSVRERILAKGERIDGRDLTTVRPLAAQTGCLPRSHGSVVFDRGETQALVSATLCGLADGQMIDTIEGAGRQRFMLNYNFPPFSVGEPGRVGAVSRREMGHGRLAWKAVSAMLPSEKEFPYAIRCVSEVLCSNGSSSMATVCGTSLALMDASVPLKAPVAGIAMGLIQEGSKTAVLTDILGDEDHLGDMDFKVAGTAEGVTALQMDLKVPFVDKAILKKALADARKARLHILDVMNAELSEPRKEMHESAPAIRVLSLPKDSVGRVIGSGGRVIKGLTERHKAQIDIAPDGTATIFAQNQKSARDVVAEIEGLLYEPKKGDKGKATVKKIFNNKVLLDFKGHFGVLRDDGADMQEGDTIEVCIESVDKANDKIFFKHI
ncbi:MAG: polyribonucleotide nucleotidyltransferase [Alphaproteobacteria bacterium]|nr:polyribonucleotide nucleotidyltransferase [Alphaproteobacteria bacterium]